MLILISFQAMAFQENQVDCHPAAEANSEIFALLATVKNDILGTVPKFCRADKPSQLADQNDKREEVLNEFVNKLKKINPDDKDVIELNLSTKEMPDAIIFKTLKMMVLKKMWLQSSESNQYSILYSEACGEMGLNRMPSSKINTSAVKEKDPKKALSWVLQVCRAQQFDELAFYLSKDVLAEALLNLKVIFPQSFPQLVSSLCEKLENTNEVIFKQDYYDSFSSSDVATSSAKDYSKWLKDIYSEVNVKQNQGQIVLSEIILSKYQSKTSKVKKMTDITTDEYKVLNDYTNKDFAVYNNCLRKGKCHKNLSDPINVLTSTLKKINKKNDDYQIIYRGVGNLPAQIVTELEKNPKEFVMDKGFMSASGNIITAKTFATAEGADGMVFMMKTKSCTGISQFSAFPGEDEFLCPPGMKFNVKKKSNEPRIYILEEVGI